MYKKQPIIGLCGSFEREGENPRHFLNESYFHAIRHFGGIPLLIPVLAEPEELEYLANQCDGLVLTGGDDLDPALFGETLLNDTVNIAPERDRGEYALLDLVLKKGIPILGICRGIQVMNVYCGGTLYQDIPSQVPSDVQHRMEKPNHRTCHRCLTGQNSPLHTLTGLREFGVNSHHHQAVRDLAPNFICMGRSEDGIIEAIYDPGKPFFWGVQWHPERIWDIEESSAKLFQAFLAACAGK